MDAQLDTVIRELETLASLLDARWCIDHVKTALRAAKKAKALATNDYKTLWEMECEETKRLARYETLWADERLESARLAQQLLRYEVPPVDPKAHLVQAGGEPPATTQTRLNTIRWLLPDPSLVCQPVLAAPADDTLYD
jgi:hypothetical protein